MGFNKIFSHKINKLSFCQTNFLYREILQPRVFHTPMRNAAILKRSTKGPHFKEDDCTLPVYLFLLFYVLQYWLMFLDENLIICTV